MIEISLLFTISVFVAGLFMFLAPCTLPLVPPFLAVIAGTSSGSLPRTKFSLIANAAGFCLGFSLIFILLGSFASLLGSNFSAIQSIFTKLGAFLIIFFGLMLTGFIKTSFFVGNRSFPLPKFIIPGTLSSSILLGMAFSLGWSPCIGPVMASVLLVAANTGDLYSGMFLLSVFSSGLALPFMLTAIFYTKAISLIERYSHLSRFFTYFVSGLLIVLGVVLLFDGQGFILTYGTKMFYWLGLDFIYNYY